jgi:hypothetical protein
MECYHAIGSLDHMIEGGMAIDGRTFDFTGGHGYVEKDWGTSFPSAWVWTQSNDFERPRTSFVFSLARIPWIRGAFPGFFALLLEGGKFHRMATYTGAHITKARLCGRELEIEIRDHSAVIALRAKRSHEGVLLAPENGAMERRIRESIDTHINVTLTDLTGSVLFRGSGCAAGLEVVGNISSLGVRQQRATQ